MMPESNQLDRRLATLAEQYAGITDLRHANNPEVRCAIVTGNGRAFSTGHDLVAMANARANEGPSTGDLYVVQANIWKPIIAAINGICLAQGCGIALGSDIRVASSEAQFGWPQAKRGLASVSGPALLSHVVPRNIAFEFLFTGDFVDAQRALDLMLVNYVVPPEEVMPKAEEPSPQNNRQRPPFHCSHQGSVHQRN